VYWYRFIAYGSATAYYEDDGARNGGWGQTFGSAPDNSWQLSIYDPADRFRDGNNANNPSAGEFFYGANDTICRSNDTEWNTHICDPRDRPGSSLTCTGK